MGKNVLRLGFVLIAGAVLVGCAVELPQPQLAQQPTPMVWLRLDGQRGADNPALTQQFEMDRKVCLGSAPENGPIDPEAKACMAQKGYIQVPADQAEAKNRELAAANAQRNVPVSPSR
jgi:hypothetical protein